ncbi:MAG: glycosyltransferase [Alphaproteobacteria bacterium]
MKQKPIVLQVVEAFGGGVYHSTLHACKPLEKDFDFVVLYSRRPETPDTFVQDFPVGTRFIEWRARRDISPKNDWAAMQDLRRIVAEVQPVCVHAHSSKAGALARIAKFVDVLVGGAFKDIPLYYSPRAYGFLQQTENPIKRMIFLGAEVALGVLPHTTVACGAGELNMARWIAPLQRKIAIYNSLNLRELDDVTRNVEKHETFTVVGAGRISPQKNFPLFVALAKELESEGVNFVWVGHGDGVAVGTLPANLRLTGWVDQTTCLRELAAGHVYVQTSLWEGLPRTVIEAMALSLPVVVSNVSGNRELVEQERDGYVCADKMAFVEAILTLKTREAQRLRMGRAARAKVEHDYSDVATKKAWKDLYSGKA